LNYPIDQSQPNMN